MTLERLEWWRNTLWMTAAAMLVGMFAAYLVEEHGPQNLAVAYLRARLHQVPPDAVQADAHGIEDVVGECLPR